MNFSLSEEHQMIRKLVRDFAKHEVAPTAAERDEQERFDRELFREMANLGLTGIPCLKITAESEVTIWPTSSRWRSCQKCAPPPE